MSTTITLNKTFEIELEDNSIINVMVCLEASCHDPYDHAHDADDPEDSEASQRIKIFTYDNVIEPLLETLTELFISEDLADSIG